MHQLKHNVNLTNYHTFSIPEKAEALFEFSDPCELIAFIKQNHNKYKKLMPLGSGSNLLFTKKFDGCLLHSKDESIKITYSDNKTIKIKTGAGLEWDKFVGWSIENDLHGLENLSGIPGTTGATPVQNIGAYGVEVKDYILEAEAIDLENGSCRKFKKEDFDFGYRNSIFKNELRNRYMIISVTYKLPVKQNFYLNYGSVEDEVQKLGEINLENIRHAIINIRNSKLPDYKKTGNAGSFFKNPIVPKRLAETLEKKFPEMPIYKTEHKDKVKIAAGWLIDQCGLKGYTLPNGAAVHDKQALVIINKGVKNGRQLLNLAGFIQEKVLEQFDIKLEPEVTII